MDAVFENYMGQTPADWRRANPVADDQLFETVLDALTARKPQRDVLLAFVAGALTDYLRKAVNAPAR